MIILWIPATLLVAFAVLTFTLRASRRSLPALVLPEGESLPSTPVQRLAARTLIGVSVFAVDNGPCDERDRAIIATAWSCIMVSLMALLAGVVIGYRRS